MLSDLIDKVVLITGSSTGIGAATAKLFASCGSKVVITGRNEERLKLVAAECYNLSPNNYEACIILGELDKEKDVQHLAYKTIEKFGKIDVLVNNASSFKDVGILDSNVLRDFDESSTVNSRSVLQLCNLLLPHLISSKGCIVNVSATPYNLYPVASMAKSSLDSLSKVLALEFAPKGVRVNTIHVGATLTETVMSNPHFDEWKDGYISALPLRRFANPTEIANAILFLASDLASFVTGIELKCDGGVSVC